jgi:tripartite-type tricarboxylate transporter receptor subunit TctC
MTEQGLPAATITGWYAFLAPKGTPKLIITRLNTELTRILQTAEMREQLAREGSEPAIGTPEQLGKHIASEVDRLGRLVKTRKH